MCQAEKEYLDLGLPAVPGPAPRSLCCPCRPSQDGASLPWGASLASPPQLPGHPACIRPEPWWVAPRCPAAGSQVPLPAATRRKLFELARAFSEKTKMRKSKRKHLLKHQSYPFWPGPGGEWWVLRAPRPWAGLPEAARSLSPGPGLCGPPLSLSPAASLLRLLSVPASTTMTRPGERASIPRPPSSWRLRIVLQLLCFLPGVKRHLGRKHGGSTETSKPFPSFSS